MEKTQKDFDLKRIEDIKEMISYYKLRLVTGEHNPVNTLCREDRDMLLKQRIWQLEYMLNVLN